MSLDRRQLLRVLGVSALGGIAGCNSLPGRSPTPTFREGTPTSTPTPTISSTQTAKLVADDGDEDDRFGHRVAMSGDGSAVIVGAPEDEDPNGYDAGSVYTFTRREGEWTQKSKLVPRDGGEDDSFGSSVALSSDGTTAVVGARTDNDPNGDAGGSVYVFSKRGGGWTQEAKLSSEGGDKYDRFGIDVAVSGDGNTAVVGAKYDRDPNGKSAGTAYVFSRTESVWDQQAKLVPEDGDPLDVFGTEVTISRDGTTVLIGADGDEDPNGKAAGSVYVFRNVVKDGPRRRNSLRMMATRTTGSDRRSQSRGMGLSP